jgi:hypothetical protein
LAASVVLTQAPAGATDVTVLVKAQALEGLWQVRIDATKDTVV